MKEILQVELTPENVDVLFQAIVRNYLHSGKTDTPVLINALVVQITALLVSEYCTGSTKDKSFYSKELYVILHKMLLNYCNYMEGKDYEEFPDLENI
jgi:hypothetical protein